MPLHKTPLPSPFAVQTVITFYRIRFGVTSHGGDWHDFPELLYVREGTHRVLVDGELFELEEGQAIIYAPNAYHIGPSKSTALVDIVSFETDLADLGSVCNRVLTLTATQRQTLSCVMAQGAKCFTRVPKGGEVHGFVPREDTNEWQLMYLKNHLELLLIDLYCSRQEPLSPSRAANRENRKAELLGEVNAYLKANLHRSLTQEEIAKSCNLSVSTLKSLFKAQVGCGPISYLHSLRIGEAKRMLCDSALNVTQIAERLGFGSIHHFSSFFKEKTGLSPSEYAKTV